MKLFILQFFPFSCYFLSTRFVYSHEHLLLMQYSKCDNVRRFYHDTAEELIETLVTD
jgi:hypothetical protein